LLQGKSATKVVEPAVESGQKAAKGKRRRGKKIRGTGERPNSVKVVRKRKQKTGAFLGLLGFPICASELFHLVLRP
jgi:hypothetical protein